MELAGDLVSFLSLRRWSHLPLSSSVISSRWVASSRHFSAVLPHSPAVLALSPSLAVLHHDGGGLWWRRRVGGGSSLRRSKLKVSSHMEAPQLCSGCRCSPQLIISNEWLALYLPTVGIYISRRLINTLFNITGRGGNVVDRGGLQFLACFNGICGSTIQRDTIEVGFSFLPLFSCILLFALCCTLILIYSKGLCSVFSV